MFLSAHSSHSPMLLTMRKSEGLVNIETRCSRCSKCLVIEDNHLI